MALGLLGILAPVLGEVIDRVLPDSNKANELKVAVQMAILEQEASLRNAQRDIIVAEANSESWLTRTWRPIAMVTFLSIIVWRTFLGPLVAALGGFDVAVLVLPMDPDIEGSMYTLMTVGIGGYAVGRTMEKAADRVFSHRQNDNIIDSITGNRSDD